MAVTALLSCKVKAKSSGDLRIKWFKDGDKFELKNDGEKVVISSTGVDTLTKSEYFSSLKITNFGLGDGDVGSYFCRVIDAKTELSDSSRPISLEMLGKIIIE